MEKKQTLEKLTATLNKLIRLEAALKNTKSYSQDLMNLEMLIDFVKEQVGENSHPTTS